METQHDDVLSYKIIGNGKPLVCIHGLNLNKKMFEYGTIKNKFKNSKIIAFDLPGYGDSKELKINDVDKISKLILNTLEKLNIKNFSLCGYCMGGVFALDIIKLYPNRVNELYLLETMLIYPRWLELSKMIIFEKGYNLLNKSNVAKVLSLIPQLREFTSNERNKFCDRKWHRQVNSEYLNLLKKMHIEEYQEFLLSINIKCNIVLGSNTYDEVFETASILQRCIKQTNLIVIENKGHLFFIE